MSEQTERDSRSESPEESFRDWFESLRTRPPDWKDLYEATQLRPPYWGVPPEADRESRLGKLEGQVEGVNKRLDDLIKNVDQRFDTVTKWQIATFTVLTGGLGIVIVKLFVL